MGKWLLIEVVLATWKLGDTLKMSNLVMSDLIKGVQIFCSRVMICKKTWAKHFLISCPGNFPPASILETYMMLGSRSYHAGHTSQAWNVRNNLLAASYCISSVQMGSLALLDKIMTSYIVSLYQWINQVHWNMLWHFCSFWSSQGCKRILLPTSDDNNMPWQACSVQSEEDSSLVWQDHLLSLHQWLEQVYCCVLCGFMELWSSQGCKRTS